MTLEQDTERTGGAEPVGGTRISTVPSSPRWTSPMILLEVCQTRKQTHVVLQIHTRPIKTHYITLTLHKTTVMHTLQTTDLLQLCDPPLSTSRGPRGWGNRLTSISAHLLQLSVKTFNILVLEWRLRS